MICHQNPYLCTCTACGHRFSSDTIPLPRRRGLLASIFPKKSAPPPPAEGHRAPAQDGTAFRAPSVPCPQCGSHNVRFCAVVD